jgi:6-phosphogluconolactonase/glucosamine-6-phosphate isomerase/deaminase
MNIKILADAATAARVAASIIAESARTVVVVRGRLIMAVSGSHTPWLMLRALANGRSLGRESM